MGLDIFIWRLKKNTYRSSDDVAEDIKDYWRKQNYEDHGQEEIEKACPFTNEDKAIYFRKVNFLYAYFEGLLDQDEMFALFDKGYVEDLIKICEEVLDHHKNDEDKGVDFAEANLPTCSGFFFGSTEYDDYYFGDVSNVLDKLTALNEEITYEDQLVIDFDY